MKTLEDFTPEIRAKIQGYKDRCVKDLYSGKEYGNFDINMTVSYIEKIYEIAKKERPVIIIADDPIDYKRKFQILQTEKAINIVNDYYIKLNETDSKVENMFDFKSIKIKKSEIANVPVKSHYLYLCSAYHRVFLMWYKFIQDEFKIDHKNKEILDWLYENGNNNISRCYFTQLYVLVLRMPHYIRRNAVGFHSTTLPAIEWDNYKMYYINGRKITEEIFNAVNNKTYTFDEFVSESNDDVKASITSMISENFGNEGLMEFLNATIVDEKVINHSSGYSEAVKLWKTRNTYAFLSDINGNLNQPYAWLELVCPSSGSKYLIPTSPHFTDAVESCKYHRPESIPMELKYDFTQFNN